MDSITLKKKLQRHSRKDGRYDGRYGYDGEKISESNPENTSLKIGYGLC